jgi:hypothetical protein
MKFTDGKYLHTTIHDFKTHFSSYLSQLEREHYRAVVVYRRNKKVGMFVPYEPRVRELNSGMEPYS